jgi:hypothetical protein
MIKKVKDENEEKEKRKEKRANNDSFFTKTT